MAVVRRPLLGNLEGRAFVMGLALAFALLSGSEVVPGQSCTLAPDKNLVWPTLPPCRGSESASASFG
jgi:hypothetical protein